MDYEKIKKELKTFREYINHTITDVEAVINVHDNDEQVENSLYHLADGLKDFMLTIGHHMK